jgi:hypothetical protein
MIPNPAQAEPPVYPPEPTCFQELLVIHRAAPDVLSTYLGEDLDVDSLSCAQVVQGLLMASVEVPADFRLRTVNLALNLLHSQNWSSFIAKGSDRWRSDGRRLVPRGAGARPDGPRPPHERTAGRRLSNGPKCPTWNGRPIRGGRSIFGY